MSEQVSCSSFRQLKAEFPVQDTTCSIPQRAKQNSREMTNIERDSGVENVIESQQSRAADKGVAKENECIEMPEVNMMDFQSVYCLSVSL